MQSSSESSPREVESRLVSLRDRREDLRVDIDETKKCELLTTDRYLKHIEPVVGILEDLSNFTDCEHGPNGR